MKWKFWSKPVADDRTASLVWREVARHAIDDCNRLRAENAQLFAELNQSRALVFRLRRDLCGREIPRLILLEDPQGITHSKESPT